MRPASRIACLLPLVMLASCAAPKPAGDPVTVAMEEHRRAFGEFELPHQIGSILNLGVQLPQVSPDGTQMLYLRTDRDAISPMTILGSTDPIDTPLEGSLSIWLRPVSGTSLGRRISRQRWAHSPTFSASGQYAVYVAADATGGLPNGAADSVAGATGGLSASASMGAAGTSIVRVNLLSGKEDVLAGHGINIWPVFDRDDRTLLFAHSGKAAGPFEICRQAVGEEQPVVLTPRGMDCLFPIVSDGAKKLICGRIEGDHLDWVECSSQSAAQIVPPCGPGMRPAVLQTWAGITLPVSPDFQSFLFYDMGQDRVAVCHWVDRIVRRHRPGSIAACWLSNDAFALATADGLFAVSARTGASVSLLTGSWIPLRYVPSTARLYLLGKEQSAVRLSIYEIIFHSAHAGSGEQADHLSRSQGAR